VSQPHSASLYIGIVGLLSAGVSCSVCRAAELDLYGVGHVSADHIDVGNSSSEYVHSNSSRLGIKGDQDLTDELAIYVQYESGVDLTVHGTGDGNGGATSDGQLFTRARDSFLGVRSQHFGSLQFGRVGGLNQWVYDYNLFADQVGDLGNIWSGDGLPGRLDSAVEYLSPTLHGLKLAVTFVPDEGGQNQHDFVVKADYALAGLKLGGAYAKFGPGIAGAPSLETFALTGSYDLGFMNVGGGFQRERNIAGGSGLDRNQATFGAEVKLGANGMFKTQYTWSGELTGGSGTAAHQIVAGVDYNLSPAAVVYVAFARTSNSANNAYTAVDYGHGNHGVPPILDGKSNSAFSLGLVYKFDTSLLKLISRS
jgi:predicted porin